MAICIKVGSIADEIGAPSFVHAFFSTISAHCEPNGWGSRFPHLMNELYQGRLPADYAKGALAELREAKGILVDFPPSAVVWDIKDRTARPPWGEDVSPDITDLGNYFVSSTGRDVFELMDESLAWAVKKGLAASLESY